MREEEKEEEETPVTKLEVHGASQRPPRRRRNRGRTKKKKKKKKKKKNEEKRQRRECRDENAPSRGVFARAEHHPHEREEQGATARVSRPLPRGLAVSRSPPPSVVGTHAAAAERRRV